MKINGYIIEPGADLRGANLRGADLWGADLAHANLCDANLHGASLRGANLRGASLLGANLQRADLYNADLFGADLRCADFAYASLYNAHLYGADLAVANLRGAQLPDFQLLQEGELTGWKKVCDNIILRLRITGKRTATLTSNKCRTDKVVVEAAFNRNGTPAEGSTFHSMHNKQFIYTVGQEVLEPKYNPDPRVECTQGIHFFKTQEEAVDWYW